MVNERCVKIGLAMSGAISAGAYTGGVVDFLIEALEEWERHRGEPGVPDHRVILPVMGGSSAGAVTGALCAMAAARGPLPVGADKGEPHLLPEVFDAWVDQPDFMDSPDVGALLGETDLVGENASVVSLLDSNPLVGIGRRSVSGAARKRVAGETGVNAPRAGAAYLVDKLHVLMTMTNLRGVPYKVAFGGYAPGHRMMSHADRAHHVVTTGGLATFRARWVEDDPAQSFDPRKMDENDPEGVAYITHAIASGAFPMGLAACSTGVPFAGYERRSWPLPLPLEVTAGIRPDLEPRSESDVVPFAAVDGGALDNDPFQLVRYAMMSDPPTDDPSTAAETDRVVIMVSPFPEGPTYIADDAAATRTALSAVISRLLPTFMENARFKPEELVHALNDDNGSRWMIAPNRARSGGGVERYAIACGLLGGFGGFLDRSFRAHDYQLGRRNCQRFLARWLSLTTDNPNIDPSRASPSDGAKPRAAVIPLCGTAANEVPEPVWPRVKPEKVDAFTKAAMKRADALVPKLADQIGGLPGVILRRGWGLFLRGRAETFIRFSMMSDLIRRDQYDTPLFPTGVDGDVFRAFVAGCVSPAFDFRTAAGLAKEIGVGAKEVESFIQAATAANMLVSVDGLASATVHTFIERVPAAHDPRRSRLARAGARVWGLCGHGVGRVFSWINGVRPAPRYSID